jgi:hypothetical protein
MNSTSSVTPSSGPKRDSGPAFVLGIAAVAFLVQILTAARYGYFRDELYYLDCARHLAWGYVDQPPLIVFITWLERHVAGDSLYSLRFLPALAAGATVWLAGRLARVLGAGRVGQSLAALAVLVAPGYLALFHLLTMNAFEPLLWTAASCLVVRIIQTGNQRLWLWFGILTGVGILNKWSMLFYGAGLVVGLLLTRERRALVQHWIWFGFALAMLIWLPNVLWNVQHHWPFLELMRNVRASGRDFTRAPIAFLADQAFFMNYFTAPLWMAGAWWYFFGRDRADAQDGGRYRVLGWTYLFLVVFFIVAKGKSYYLWPIYPTLFAAGGLAVEQWTRRRARMLRPAYAVALALVAVPLAPMVVPILSPGSLIRYRQTLHLGHHEIEHMRNGPLQQQIFADMFGWDEMARETARAYFSLPAEIRSKTAIAGDDYGETAAIDFFGPKYGLPNAISGHQTYWLWGPGHYTGESILLLREDPEHARDICGSVDVVGHVYQIYSREDEHFDIYWCHPLKWSLQEIWPRAKHFN